MEILLQYGAHLGGALHCAAYKGDTRIVQLLIRFSADVNSQNQHNYTTPLHIASRFGYIDIVECLGMFFEYDVNINKNLCPQEIIKNKNENVFK